MAGKQGHLVDRLSDRIASEVERVSDDLAGKVNAELLDDQHELPRAQFLERWRASWNDPQWRMQQYQRMGAEGFYDATMDAFGAPKPAPLGRLARDGMTTMAKQGVAQAQAPAGAPPPEEPGLAPPAAVSPAAAPAGPGGV
jgi:hypothetical protein